MSNINWQTKQIISLLFSIIVAGFFYYFFQSQESYWLFLSTLGLSLLTRTSLSLQLTCGLLIALNVFISHFFSSHVFLLCSYIIFSTSFLGLLGRFFFRFFIFFFLINFFGILGVGVPTLFLLERVGFILIGMFIVIITNLIFNAPIRKNIIADFYYHLDQLQQLFFTIYLNKNYFDLRFQYEKAIHQELIKLFGIIVKLNKYQQSAFYNSLLENVISLGELRYRLKDQATFEVCQKEMVSISQVLTKIFLGKNKAASLLEFKKAIKAFKHVYQNTLVIVTNDPLDFLIFIDYLYDLKDILSE